MANTGNVFPGAGANVDRASSTAWTSPGNVVSDNATDTTVVVPSDYLVCSSFDFSSIPDGAIIKGVTVRVEASETGSGTSNYVPQLISDTTPTLIGSPKSAVTVSGSTKVISTNGGTADLWGATLTSAIVKNSGFGVAIWSTDTTNTLAIDFVTIAIEYVVPVAVNQASETDSAQPITAQKKVTLGIASETDTPQAIAALRIYPVGQANETDSAFSITRQQSQIINVGQAIETDAAQAIIAVKSVTLGIATETDKAQPVFQRLTYYVNTDSTAGGTGKTSAASGTDRAFHTIAAAISALAQDLRDGGTGTNVELTIECSAPGSVADTSRPSDLSSSWGGSTTRQLIIKAASGHRFTGKYDTSKYRIEWAGGNSGWWLRLPTTNPMCIRLDGIQCKFIRTGSGTGNGGWIETTSGAQSGSRVEMYGCACVVDDTGYSGTGSTRWIFSNDQDVRIRLKNCLFTGALVGGLTGLLSVSTSSQAEIYNCTLVNNTRAFSALSASWHRVKNCLFKGNTTDINGTAHTDSNYNATDQASGMPGANSRHSQTFTFADEGNGDYRLLSSDAGAKNFGTSLAADGQFALTDDVEGQTRPGGSDWDIGYDEVFGITQSIGLASETDSGFSITPAKRVTTGLASESDVAQPMAKILRMGLASEENSAQSIIPAKRVVLGIASETDQSQAFAAQRRYALGLANETEAAQPVAAQKKRELGPASETDEAFTIVRPGALGFASETDQALPIQPVKSLTLGVASEAGTALAFTVAKRIVIGPSTEGDAAQSIASAKRVSVGLALETDAGLSVIPAHARALGLASELDSALALGQPLVVVLGIAVETNAALPLVLTPPNASRRLARVLVQNAQANAREQDAETRVRIQNAVVNVQED